MDDVWFAPGLTRRDFKSALDALALRSTDQPPLLVVASGNDRADLLLASRALFTLFEVTSDKALAHRLLNGSDPGARRLSILCQTMAPQGAPRLERLRFFLGPGSEIITFLCRRISLESGTPVFVAAALGLRPGLIPDMGTADVGASTSLTDLGLPPVANRASPISLNVQAIQASLKAQWPGSRTVRFLWQTDAEGVCTLVTPTLAEVVGVANADLVGRRLVDIASMIDPSGRFAEALARKATWSGLDVTWPISDAAASVMVGLGAIPVQDRERGFDGYRGYGVIHLDRITPGEAKRFPTQGLAAPTEAPAAAGPDNVVPFPGGVKMLSAADQRAFDALGIELREEAGLNEAKLPSLVEEPSPAPVIDVPMAGQSTRDHDIARNGLAVLDRLALGLLVSRDSIPIFANRHLLDQLGFKDEDALHAAGGIARLFGVPDNAGGNESIGLRAQNGALVPVTGRMQSIDWNGLPATLLTLHPPVQPEPAPPQPNTNDREIRELRAILETATDGVAVLDGQCDVLSLNRSGEALFGCDRGTVIGKSFLSLFAPETSGLVSDYLEGIKSNATKSLLNDGREMLIRTQQGGTIPVFMTLGRLDTGETGDDARFCALFRDLTHGKTIEQALDAARQSAERASALKTDFLAKVSHEVRTPLNAIIGFAEVMMEERFGAIGNDRYKGYLRDIHASGTHVMSLVNDLLDLSKIEAGKMQLAEETIDLNKVVGDCVSMMQPQASRERVILRLSLAQRLLQIKADERSLRQIVLNLLSNAVKYNEPGGQVIVASAATDAGQVVIRIRDTGPGMSDEDIAAALEPFRQLSTAHAGEGTGLGLPLTKALVEANQASLTIKSKLAHGTLVEVAFPPARVLAT